MRGSPYTSRCAGLATRHAKEEAIAPAFLEVLGMGIEVVDIDTDSFGTFTGDVPRIHAPRTTAIAKARAGMFASGHTLGLASEGTIGPHPFMPFATYDTETIVFVDDVRGIVISETTRSDNIVAIRQTVTSDDDLATALDRADFPQHGLVVRPPESYAGPIAKGITSRHDLIVAVRKCTSNFGSAVVENDLRACFSPSRMRNIRECAVMLAQRVATPCPECASPGWGRIEPIRGLPCSACETFVKSAVRADAFGCPACETVHEIPRPSRVVEPQWCPMCNP